MNWTTPYPWRSRRDSVRRINMSSEPGNESFFFALRPIPRILSLHARLVARQVRDVDPARQRGLLTRRLLWGDRESPETANRCSLCRAPGPAGFPPASYAPSLGSARKALPQPATPRLHATLSSIPNTATEPQLRRELGLRDLVLFNIAAVISIRWLAAAAHTGPVSITLWLLAGAFFFVPSALAVATLSAKFPQEGGIYVWTKQGFGDWHGFLCGWCYWHSNLFYFPNLLLAGVDMAGYALGLSEVKIYVISASMLILWLGLLTNVFGLSVAKWTNNAGALATYTFGALLIVFGFTVWLRSGSATPIHLAPHWDLEKVNFWSQIAFAFGGLELGAILGGEIRNPARNVPRAAWISGSCIAAFYILGTLSLMVLMPPDRISILTGLVEASTEAGARLHSAWLGPAMVVLILAGVAGQLCAWIGGCARLP